MTDMQPCSARVWEHVKDVRFGLGRIQLGKIRRSESLVPKPVLLPLGFNICEGVGTGNR